MTAARNCRNASSPPRWIAWERARPPDLALVVAAWIAACATRGAALPAGHFTDPLDEPLGKLLVRPLPTRDMVDAVFGLTGFASGAESRERLIALVAAIWKPCGTKASRRRWPACEASAEVAAWHENASPSSGSAWPLRRTRKACAISKTGSRWRPPTARPKHAAPPSPSAGGFPVTGDIDAIFADGTIDAVMVLTPPNTHLELMRRAARAGKHVLLEKPLEITLERAQALVDAAESAGIKLGIVLQHRFRPASVALAR